MRNMIDYVETEKASFQEKAFHGVDSLVLSKLAYFSFDGFVPDLEGGMSSASIRELAERDDREELYRNTSERGRNKRLLMALAASPRFSGIGAGFYVNRLDFVKEKQFSATTFLLGDGTAYVAFRGTDSTFVGWKEDFNMSFSRTIPSQEESVLYLNAVGGSFSGGLRLGGHSKGGNLAVFASMNCREEIRERITDIYSHDGPGFRKEVFQSTEYRQVRNRIRHSMPQSALIGMLLEHHETYVVVKSRRIGIMQHNPYSWLVKDDDFEYLEEIDPMAVYADRTIREWLGSLSDEKRELFIDTLYSVMKATDARFFSDLTVDRRSKARAALSAIRGIDEETRHFVLQTVGSLMAMAVKVLKAEMK
ncbi:DUF2974 domain-containing protein [Lachnospiraceae bacterium 54-53]